MNESIETQRQVSAAELKEIERLRSLARHNEASALNHARREGYREAEQKWQGVITEIIAEKDAIIAELRTQLRDKMIEAIEAYHNRSR